MEPLPFRSTWGFATKVFSIDTKIIQKPRNRKVSEWVSYVFLWLTEIFMTFEIMGLLVGEDV